MLGCSVEMVLQSCYKIQCSGLTGAKVGLKTAQITKHPKVPSPGMFEPSMILPRFMAFTRSVEDYDLTGYTQ